MRREWTRSDGVTVTYTQRGDHYYVRLYRPKDSHVINKEFAYWEAGYALYEAMMLVELLGLEEVHAEDHPRAA